MALEQVYTRYLAGADWYSRSIVSLQAKRFAQYLTKDMKVLEIGCGSGVDADYFRRLGFSIRTCDIKGPIPDDISICEELIYPDNSFDAIFCRGVLHLTECVRALSEVNRVIKGGGLCYLSYPRDIKLDDEFYQLVEDEVVTGYYGKLLYRKTRKTNHGHHSHWFEEYLGLWRVIA